MALKLPRRAVEFTNAMLAHRRGPRHPQALRTGAVSFKRVLDGGDQSPSLTMVIPPTKCRKKDRKNGR
jgi:hypothetical protein